MENVKTIGERWGPVLHVDYDDIGIRNLSSARMIVRTKAQNRIDGRIRVLFENGCCEVWVKERSLCECEAKRVHDLEKRNVDPDEEDDSSKIHMVSESPVGLSNEKGKSHVRNDAVDNDMVLNEPPENQCHNLNEDDDPHPLIEPQTECAKMSTQAADPIVECLWTPAVLPSPHPFFDPIAMIEANAPSSLLVIHKTTVLPPSGTDAVLVNHNVCTSTKRTRGRPKTKFPPSCNNDMVIQSSSLSVAEAHSTWSIAKMIDITTNNEEAVMSNLHKSKRLQLMEESAQVSP
ncbi:unnamed protein product [Amaranthus hypochondriacus]